MDQATLRDLLTTSRRLTMGKARPGRRMVRCLSRARFLPRPRAARPRPRGCRRVGRLAVVLEAQHVAGLRPIIGGVGSRGVRSASGLGSMAIVSSLQIKLEAAARLIGEEPQRDNRNRNADQPAKSIFHVSLLERVRRDRLQAACHRESQRAGALKSRNPAWRRGERRAAVPAMGSSLLRLGRRAAQARRAMLAARLAVRDRMLHAALRRPWPLIPDLRAPAAAPG